MDRIVSVRFFRVSRASASHPALADLLERIGDTEPVQSRERQLLSNLDVRLEVFEKDGKDMVVGEMTRLQSTNLPSHISSGARSALPDVDRLGHSIVFRYNSKTSVLAFQHDARILPLFRFFQYLHLWENAKFEYAPIVRDDMWARFESKSPRVLEIAIAEPASMQLVDGDANPVLDAVSSMGEAYGAPTIQIKISMGHHKGKLADRAVKTAKSLMNLRSSGRINLNKLSAKSSSDEGSDTINLLEELLEHKEELELHRSDPDVNYQLKLQYLKRCMQNVS